MCINLEMSVTANVIENDIFLQLMRVNAAKCHYKAIASGTKKSFESAQEALEALRTERKILFYMECSKEALQMANKQVISIKI